MSVQHIMMTKITATVCGDMSQQQLNNCFLCTGSFCKNLGLHNRILSLHCIKSNQFEFVGHVVAKKFCHGDKDFHKRFSLVTVNVLQQRAAKCVQTFIPALTTG